MYSESYCLIPLLHYAKVVGYAKVDEDDYEHLAQFGWRVANGYASRTNLGARGNVGMARELLGLSKGDGFVADHINRDRLDNRRMNLRAVTHAENMQNVSAHRGSRSGYRGVHWNGTSDKWVASARVEGRSRFLGLFDTPEGAHEVVSAFRAQHMPYSEDAQRLLVDGNPFM